ncbi:MAG: hypothetical protein RL173_985 [Fibrobacterota bacterium]|jgi:adenosylcobinamide-phosphate synthase
MALVFAILLDLLFAEPPIPAHPVVWMGRYLAWLGKLLPKAPGKAFLLGAGGWCFGALACVGTGAAIEWRLGRLELHWRWVVEGLVMWPLFSIRMLFTEVASVEKGLSISLMEGRRRLSRIVSRDTAELPEVVVRESALESLSENLSDSVIAPIFWWGILGLPGIFLYRFANTADACWGYRGDWEWKGKWAAIADDVLNWIPSRLTAMLLGGLFRLARLRTQAAVTPSPNGGWPMGALALALGVRLSKPGVYVLNPGGRSPLPKDSKRALRLCGIAVAVGVVLLLSLKGVFDGGL